MFILLPDDPVPDSQLPSLNEISSLAERSYLMDVLHRAKWNVSEAARLAGRNRTDFYKIMAKHNVMTPRQKARLPVRDTAYWDKLREQHRKYSQSIGIKV